MYRVTQSLIVKVCGVIKTFPAGSIVRLPEKAAQMFVKQGKIKPVAEELPAGYELSERMAIMGENTEPEQTLPYVDKFNVLVIPWNSDPKYHYWKPGGQSTCVTPKELGRCDLIPKYRSIYSN